MRVLFLDFDGVLNSDPFLRAESKRARRREKGKRKANDPRTAIDPAAVAMVNTILERTGAKVVISSSWRVPYSLDEIRGFLYARGFDGVVIDATPVIAGVPRGEEIAFWLHARGERMGVETFAILDDCTDMGRVQDRLIQTTWERGLEPEHVERAIAMLEAKGGR